MSKTSKTPDYTSQEHRNIKMTLSLLQGEKENRIKEKERKNNSCYGDLIRITFCI